MGGRKHNPGEQERREKIQELLHLSGVSSMEDIQNLFKETIAEFMEDGLDAELAEGFGYSKYDYKCKNTDNNRNGLGSKALCTGFGKADVSIPPRPQGRVWATAAEEESGQHRPGYRGKILSMYINGMTTGDIEPHIRDIYGLKVSDTTVSRITDKILPMAKE